MSTEVISGNQSGLDHTGEDFAIVTSTIYKLKVPGEYSEKFSYSRYGNPTRDSLEKSLASLDRADFAFAFSSKVAGGLALLSSLKAEDLVIFNDKLICEKFKSLVSQLKLEFVEFNDLKSFEQNLSPVTKMVWIEDPLLTVIDIKAIAEIIHEKTDALLVVDNTLLTPHFQRPLELGADVVIYSVGEFIGGHDDVMMGSVVTNNKTLSEKLKYSQYSAGAVPSPFDCYNVIRSLKTLELRMERHSKTSCAVVQFLEQHSRVRKVFHSSLKTHRNHAAKRHCAIISFYTNEAVNNPQKFLESFKLIEDRESFGGSKSSVSLFFVNSDEETCEKESTFVRLSIGLENPVELISDLHQALQQI